MKHHPTKLTCRQSQVLSLYATGMNRSEICAQLGITTKTVDTHIRLARIFLSARTIHHAVAMFVAAETLNGRGRYSRQEDSVGERVIVTSQ